MSVIEEDSDRLSSLPECVLITHILSKLDVEEMVQTCVLSKKWRNHWTFVPCLDFHAYEYKFRHRPESFENFVTEFLNNRDDATNLDTFSLFDPHSSSASARMWVIYALNHNPRKLFIELRLSGDDRIRIPDRLFTCEPLEDICFKLYTDGDREKFEPGNVRLLRLTKFELSGACVGGDSIKKLLSGCPALESLCLDGTTLETKTMSFPNLKKLAIINCSLPSNCSISALALECLNFAGKMGPGTKLVDMCNVTTVFIEGLHYDETGLGNNLQLLSGLSSVESLDITGSCLNFPLLQVDLPGCRIFLAP